MCRVSPGFAGLGLLLLYLFQDRVDLSIQRGVFPFQSPPFFIELRQINLRPGAGFENAVEAPLSRYGLLLLLFAQRPPGGPGAFQNIGFGLECDLLNFIGLEAEFAEGRLIGDQHRAIPLQLAQAYLRAQLRAHHPLFPGFGRFLQKHRRGLGSTLILFGAEEQGLQGDLVVLDGQYFSFQKIATDQQHTLAADLAGTNAVSHRQRQRLEENGRRIHGRQAHSGRFPDKPNPAISQGFHRMGNITAVPSEGAGRWNRRRRRGQRPVLYRAQGCPCQSRSAPVQLQNRVAGQVQILEPKRMFAGGQPNGAGGTAVGELRRSPQHLLVTDHQARTVIAGQPKLIIPRARHIQPPLKENGPGCVAQSADRHVLAAHIINRAGITRKHLLERGK